LPQSSEFAVILQTRISQQIERGRVTRRGYFAGLLRQIDTAMENASEGHLAANKTFSQASRDIEAVQTGREASMRGRTEEAKPYEEA
jgi:hypothetical protein